MQYNKKTAADIAIENKVKQESTKLAKKAGKGATKAAFKVTQKMWMIGVGLFGAPTMFLVVFCGLLLFALPAMIATTTLGTDASTPQAIEQNKDADKALESRKNQLSSILLWDDITSIFSKGEFGNSAKLFQSDIADANDLDQDGTPVSEGYFSSSNKILTILNETFKSSLKGETRAGILFDSKTVREAKGLADKGVREKKFINEAIAMHPNVPEGNILQVVEKDLNMEDRNFLYESAYLLSASSFVSSIEGANQGEEDKLNTSVRDLLDYAFYFTGIDDFYTGSKQLPDYLGKTCWVPKILPAYTYRTEREIVGTEEVPILDENGNHMKNDLGELLYNTVDIWDDVPYVDVVITYSVDLIENYKDFINFYCNISNISYNTSDGENMVSDADIVNISTLELLKFYHQSIDIGDIGLPLPSGQYSIGCKLNCGCSTHNGVHTGLDLPAGKGTPVYAIADGTITAAQSGRNNDLQTSGKDMYGNYLEVTHAGDGSKTRYAHMDYILVAVGDTVTKGQTIGAVGNTGFSKGNHLHFEVRTNGNQALEVLNTEVGAMLEENKR